MIRPIHGACLLIALVGTTAKADFVVYRIPNTSLAVVLQGKTRVNPGRTVSFRHPKFGKLVFDLQNAEIHKAPSTSAVVQREVRKAINSKDVDEMIKAARLALRRGLLRDYYDAMKAAYKINPQHEDVQRVVKLKRQMNRPLGDSSKQEEELRKLIRDPQMKIAKSKHFVLLHDTSDKPGPNRKLPRAEERLQLLEVVYESFLLKFYSEGVELEVPKEYLKVVLFHDHDDYLRFATKMNPSLASTAGFWHRKINVSVFFDQGTHESFSSLKSLAKQLQKAKESALKSRGPGTSDLVRMANTFSLLSEIGQEDSDIEVVSHETTHQMAGNTGLLPRRVQIPVWVHEGLASYFESPRDASWSGIGAVNRDRLRWYRALEKDTEHSNIDFIVGDQIFSFARSSGTKLHGYGQAWALTHFLMETHFEQLTSFYRRLGELPPDVPFSPEVLTEVFNDVFGEDRDLLDSQWRRYMRGLKTDLEIALADD